YFAALAVSDWDYFLPRNHVDCPVKEKRYRIFEKQWKQVILLWLGREDVKAQEKEGFIRGLVEFKDGVEDFYALQAFFLAAAGINEFKTCSRITEITEKLAKLAHGYLYGSYELEEIAKNILQNLFYNQNNTLNRDKIIPENRWIEDGEFNDGLIENCKFDDYLIEYQPSLYLLSGQQPKSVVCVDPLTAALKSINNKLLFNNINDLIEFLLKNDISEKLDIAYCEIKKLITWLRRQRLFSSEDYCLSDEIAKNLLKFLKNTQDVEIINCDLNLWFYIESVNPNNISLIYKIRIACVKLIDFIHEKAKNEQLISFLIQIGDLSKNDIEMTDTLVSTLVKITPVGHKATIDCLITMLEANLGSDCIDTRKKIAKGFKSIAGLGLGYNDLNTIQQLIKVWTETSFSSTFGCIEDIFLHIVNKNNALTILSNLISSVKDEICISYINNSPDPYSYFTILYQCAENLPYPEFYQAWHHPPTTPHPEVLEPTPNRVEQSFAPTSLKHLPIYCLNADILTDETREREIAFTISELIWEITCPEEDTPEPATPAELRRHLKSLQRRNLEPHRAILFGGETFSTPTKPTPELITFCQKLTGVIAIAFLTEEPLEAPLKGFPPNQPNLISAIETWLKEI
ncbi:MAG: hypothetical protein ACRCU2_23175, partial [Planktothrix sp.]